MCPSFSIFLISSIPLSFHFSSHSAFTRSFSYCLPIRSLCISHLYNILFPGLLHTSALCRTRPMELQRSSLQHTVSPHSSLEFIQHFLLTVEFEELVISKVTCARLLIHLLHYVPARLLHWQDESLPALPVSTHLSMPLLHSMPLFAPLFAAASLPGSVCSWSSLISCRVGCHWV